ncbi:MAG: 4Fe-4S dicluster domain-containing protein [Armatimonadota bacterium]|nr:4Fe-4S dicluster domain-containing protein [Armatimonadota bacterium]MDR7426658.1 4Fe-4S dicluster domain-containing protein [Armatimonadota bacterium]MDR7463667.1 4Fe-4S dicluster domain-containing protein [Armatimonadota bacterium]MDR7468678.1 4Fe-4S dicluster domain-containing protein [Armatimonadota bacterium]MDR7473801.1 4Fe-4S dicluster domain-containing protein [Armatimonadota bacterium]
MAVRLNRRQFLQLAAAAGAGVTVLSAAPPVAARAGWATGTAAAAILIDIARCIGCRSCEAACKAYHNFPQGEARDLSPTAWTYVRTIALQSPRPHLNLGDGGAGRRTFKVQCMHCLTPACASACPVAALQKTPQGPVVYDASRCIGCRYCMVACPFQVPRFEWRSPLPRITKCNMCAERQQRRELPACVEACPVGALQFGLRPALLAEAARRISADPRYVPAIFGAEEAGGTSVLYISDVPFEELGFPVVVCEPLPAYTWRVLGKLPGIVLTLGALLTAVEALARRRNTLPPPGGAA